MTAVASEAPRVGLGRDRGATPDELASVVVALLLLAGGRIASWAFEPAALLLAQDGVLDLSGITFGSDYELNVRSRELRRGYVRAIDSGRVTANVREIWLSAADEDSSALDDDLAERARSVFELARPELERQARQLLLAG